MRISTRRLRIRSRRVDSHSPKSRDERTFVPSSRDILATGEFDTFRVSNSPMKGVADAYTYSASAARLPFIRSLPTSEPELLFARSTPAPTEFIFVEVFRAYTG